jgi:hypothetical protein
MCAKPNCADVICSTDPSADHQIVHLFVERQSNCGTIILSMINIRLVIVRTIKYFTKFILQHFPMRKYDSYIYAFNKHLVALKYSYCTVQGQNISVSHITTL